MTLNSGTDDFGEFLNLARHTHIHILITNADNHATNQSRVDLGGQLNAFFRLDELLQCIFKLFALSRIQLLGSNDFTCNLRIINVNPVYCTLLTSQLLLHGAQP